MTPQDKPGRPAASMLEHLAMAVHQAHEIFVVTDAAGTIEYVNPAAAAIYGYPPAGLVGRRLLEVLRSGAHDAEFYADLDGTVARGEPWSGMVLDRRSDGTLVEVEANISPILDAGRVVGTVFVGRDRTRERELESQLRQAARLEAVGRLAGGIAHEFNNVLTGILGFVALARERVADDQVAGDLAEVEVLADRAASLTSQLLAFARRSPARPAALDVNVALLALAPLLERMLGDSIRFELDPDPRPAWVVADAAVLDEVIVDLVANARDATSAGGQVRISTSVRDLTPADAEGRPGIRPGAHVIVTVSDTGEGIADENLPRIFDPFFTTRDVGAGTGLGLARVYGAIKEQGGAICVDSNLGEGTIVTLYLPAVAAAPADAPRGEVPAA